MRKIIGLIFFALSSLIIVSIFFGSFELIADLLQDLESENFLTAVGLFAAFFWDLIYQPVVVLLLSVIAMGSYSS
ncbi:MAG: hypothetical protein AB7U52_03605 [Candidatus Izemoplasmatales bacterium]